MPDTASYQVIMLGQQDGRSEKVIECVEGQLVDLGLNTETIAFFLESEIHSWNPRLPTVAVFFGYSGATDEDHSALKVLLNESLVVITAVQDLAEATDALPDSLKNVNALEVYLPNTNVDRVASLIFETFRLLRRDRKVFISYKRSDSKSIADNIYDEMDRRGFDVFIDTRTVPPAVDFQAELWHRLSDSEIVILIDTPGFRQSRWTVEELARANATNIQILHVLWPGQEEDASSAFSHFFYLSEEKFNGESVLGSSTQLHPDVLNDLCNMAERLRARAIAARYRYLIDGFCDAARDLGFGASVQPERWISMRVGEGELAIVPAVGVPTSGRLNEVFDAISDSGITERPWMVYDNRGLLEGWLKHLDWLDSHLPIRAIRMSSVEDAIRGLAK